MKQNPDKKLKLRPLRLNGVPFTWQDTRMLSKIREHFYKEKLTTALAIYLVLTELASIEGKGQGKHINCFKAYYKTIADRSGKSASTIKRYLKEFKKYKIISWNNRRKGLMNLSNEWILLHYYYQLTSKPTSVHNKKPVLRNSLKRSFINNKGQYKNYEDEGFTHISAIINKQRK